MSNPSSWIAADYVDYVRHFEQLQTDGKLPWWYEVVDFDTWLSRQSLRYLEGHASPVHPL